LRTKIELFVGRAKRLDGKKQLPFLSTARKKVRPFFAGDLASKNKQKASSDILTDLVADTTYKNGRNYTSAYITRIYVKIIYAS
jgi:hypothetical protein